MIKRDLYIYGINFSAMMENQVKKILIDIFPETSGEVIDLLENYGLLEAVNKQITFFNNNVDSDVSNLNSVVTHFLYVFNSQLIKIEEIETRESLKRILTKIANYIIDSFILSGSVDSKGLVSMVDSLKSLSKIENYDFKDLEDRLQLRKIKAIINSKNKTNSKKRYYEWVGNINILDELARNLLSQKYIQSVRDFKKLFTENPCEVSFKREELLFIIVLFTILYDKNLIKVKGGRGHFIVLKQFSVDFEKKVLYTKEMKHYKYTVKKNEAKYNIMREKAENWLKY